MCSPKVRDMYNTVCCEQREHCKYNIEGHCHGMPYNIVLKLKTEKNEGYEELASDEFRQGTPLLYECILFIY